MASILLAIIYVAFISLGLPDSLLGSAWPVMQPDLGVPLSYAGIISMIIAGCTVISSLLSDRLTRKLGTGLVTAISVCLTAVALVGFSVSGSFAMLCAFAIPYGLGAGAIDAALNNFVALHYSSRHMSWLHCCWGVGAAIGPYIMGHFLTGGGGWRGGYRAIAIIQMVLTAIMFLSIRLWQTEKDADPSAGSSIGRARGLRELLGIDGVRLILLAFFGYCALESTTGLWASSYLVSIRHLSSEAAAQYAALYYMGITLGRFLCGFIADRVGDRGMIRAGMGTIVVGILLVLIPVAAPEPALVGLLVIGLGCAPVYPSIIHATPDNFGKENSQALIGIQMGFAYIGITFMPPLFGLIAEHISIGLYPAYLLALAALVLIMTEWLNKIKRR